MSWVGQALRPLVLAALAAAAAASCGGARLPRDLGGTLLFVSNRDGRDAIYLRRLPDGADFVLVAQDEPVGEPALSPTGRRGRLQHGRPHRIVSLETHEVRFLTLGVDWKDAPARLAAGRHARWWSPPATRTARPRTSTCSW